MEFRGESLCARQFPRFSPGIDFSLFSSRGYLILEDARAIRSIMYQTYCIYKNKENEKDASKISLAFPSLLLLFFSIYELTKYSAIRKKKEKERKRKRKKN